MAHRAIPIIAFHGVESIYIYICLWPLARLCVVYVVKEIASFPGARSINGYRPAGRFRKDVKLLINVVYSRETV